MLCVGMFKHRWRCMSYFKRGFCMSGQIKSDEKKGLVPSLRFPEFVGDWEIDYFDNLVNIIDGDRGKNYPKIDEFNNIGYCIFLNANNVTKNGFKFNKIQFITKEKDKLLKKGKLQRLDIILTTRGTIGNFAIYLDDITFNHMRINSGMVILRKKSKKINIKYLYAFSKSESLTTYIKNIAFGNAQQQLTVAVIKKCPLYYPSLEEQQKIADCLSSLDGLISAQSEKIKALKAHKKGLMQRLFPAEGKRVPKLRFPEFAEAGDWEIKPLSEICSINPSITKLPNKFIYIDLKSVIAGNLIIKKEITKSIAPSRAQRLLKNNDIIYQMVRPYQKNNFLYKFSDNKYYVASTGYAQLRSNGVSEFLFYSIHTELFVNKVLEKCTGSNYPAINSTDLAKIKIYIPSYSEQQKIGGCLSSLDDLINLESRALELYKKHKKGLMQRLFPDAG